MKYKYNDRVKVISGFFEGWAGSLREHRQVPVEQRPSYGGAGYPMQANYPLVDQYLVALDAGGQHWMNEGQLVPATNPNDVKGEPV